MRRGFPAWRVALAVLAVLWYVPWLPPLPGGAVEPSWRLALAVAFERRLVFGHDLAFTFGPLGALASWMYWPAIYWSALVFWAALAGTGAWLLTDAGEHDARGWRPAAAALLVLSLTPDTALMLVPLAYCVSAGTGRNRSIASLAGLGCMGALVLVKATLIPLCLASVLCGGLLRDRRPHWKTALDLLGLIGFALACWLLAGQPLSAFTAYVALSFEVARGYAQAMAVPTRPAVAAGLAVAGMITIWSMLRAYPGPRTKWARTAWTGFVGLSMFIAWQHSILRGDAEHLVIGFCYFGALAAWSLGFHAAPRRLAITASLLCALGVAVNAKRVDSNFMNGAPFARAGGLLRGAALLAHGQNPHVALDGTLTDQRKRARAAHPEFAMLAGGFDILGHEQDLLLATNPGDWRPRPVFQGYTVYTPALSELNARFMSSASAPRWLIAPVQTIDDRLPSLDDAALWPVLRARYRVAARTASMLLLERQSTAPPPESPPGAPAVHTLSHDWTPLPPLEGAPIYARLEYDQPAWRRLLAIVWQPARYYIELRTGEAAEPRRFRLVPEIARHGFLLLPVITTPSDLADWVEHVPLQKLPISVRVTDADGRPVPARLTLCARVACPS